MDRLEACMGGNGSLFQSPIKALRLVIYVAKMIWELVNIINKLIRRIEVINH